MMESSNINERQYDQLHTWRQRVQVIENVSYPSLNYHECYMDMFPHYEKVHGKKITIINVDWRCLEYGYI